MVKGLEGQMYAVQGWKVDCTHSRGWKSGCIVVKVWNCAHTLVKDGRVDIQFQVVGRMSGNDLWM